MRHPQPGCMSRLWLFQKGDDAVTTTDEWGVGSVAGGAVTGGAEHPAPEGIHVLDIASPSA